MMLHTLILAFLIHSRLVMPRSDSENERIDLTLRLGPPAMDEKSQNALREQEKYKEYLLQKRLRYRRAKEALITKVCTTIYFSPPNLLF